MAGIQVAGIVNRSFRLHIRAQLEARPRQRRHLLQLHQNAARGDYGIADACFVPVMQAVSAAHTYRESRFANFWNFMH